MLENKIRELRQSKDILLMTHLVLGYPSFDSNRALIAEMVEAGVELIELQIPFSEPMSDGPVILKANDDALKGGTKTSACLEFAKDICEKYPETHFLFMTYANIPYVFGFANFVAKAKEIGIKGLIVPDLPPEEGAEYIKACNAQDVDPIFIFTPTNTPERLAYLSTQSRGLVYCVGRRGVTGNKTAIDTTLKETLQNYRAATKLPLALGFGIQTKDDVQAITGMVDIAVLGTKILSLADEQGPKAVGAFLKTLRL